MTPWLVALVVGAGVALAQYGVRATPGAPRPWAAMGLRLAAVTLLTALVLDARAGRAKPTSPWAALDASTSMRRGDSLVWRAAVDSAAAVGAESTFVFGDSVRAMSIGALPPPLPLDRASALRAAIDRSIIGGHPLVVVTDGEIDDPASLALLPPGSRAIVLARRAAVDAAVTAVTAPRAVVSGDTLRVRVSIVAGGLALPSGELVVAMDGATSVTAAVDALPAFATRDIELALPAGGPPGPTLVRAVLRVRGDVEPRNDTLAVAVDRARTAAAVFVSSSPDYDSRAALALLRGALGIPTRAFVRVAPNNWRVEGELRPASEREVRDALREAPVAVIHGDTAVFGSPRAATTGSLALLPTGLGSTPAGEWYAKAGGHSPLSSALAGVPWDSLPPISISSATAAIPADAWGAVDARQGRDGATFPVVVGSAMPRRIVSVAATGLWRWQFRGGVSADAFSALWGGVFDWLAGERPDRRAAVPDAASFTEGEPVRWRRGSAADTLVTVTLRRANGPERVEMVTLRFGRGSIVETPALGAGVYHATAGGGGTSLLVVNRSREWIPARPSIAAGPVGTGTAVGSVARLRDYWWVYGVVIALLSGEWVIRRRLGLR